jgi:lipoprotein-anchoring transpeptidase ErfK/SrfK
MARTRIAGAAAAALLLAGCGGHERPAAPAAVGQSRPDAQDGFSPAAFREPARPHGRWLTAQLRRAVTLRARPGGTGHGLARLRRRTEFGSPRVLGVLARRGGWLRVQAPALPNGHAGWIPAASVELGATDLSIVVDRSRRRLRLRSGSRVVARFPVAVGRPGNQTPLGRYAVTDRLHTGRADSPYGCCALALTGHQTHLPPGWPGGDRLAIHGTPEASSIGRAASLGCMRAPAAGLHVLMRRVPLGAPVFVVR